MVSRSLRWVYDGVEVKRPGMSSLQRGVTLPMSALSDDFASDNLIKWNNNGTPAPIISNGKLTIAAVSTYPRRESRFFYDLTASSAKIQVFQRPNVSNGTTEGIFQVGPEDDNSLAFHITGNTFLLRHKIDGVSDDTTVTYDPTHTSLRIRMASGVAYWETSTDGATWVVRRSKTIDNASVYSKSYLVLWAGNYGSAASPGTIVFDNLNLDSETVPPVDSGDSTIFTMLPSQDFVTSYTDEPTMGQTGAFARPGGLVLCGRTTYDHPVMHAVSEAGGTVALYIDCIINNAYGRYHDKLINASEYGAAVPNWPGPISANQWGNLNDFRPGAIMHTPVGTLKPGAVPSGCDPTWTKLEAILELAIAENPHLGGFFADDLGSRSWFPNINWAAWSSTAQQQYRDGAILVAQTFNRVAKRHKIIFLVNGTWGGGSLASNGGGYPNMNVPGLSLSDGALVEHHDYDSYWAEYVNSSQWGLDAYTKGAKVMLVIASGASGYNVWQSANIAAYVGSQYDASSYTETGPNGPGHATNLPSHSS